MLRPEERRRRSRRSDRRSCARGRGGWSRARSPPATATRGLGYTTAVDAAIPPLAARHALSELRDTPIIDKAFLVLMGNNHYADGPDRGGASRASCAMPFVAWLRGDQGVRRQGGQPRRRRDAGSRARATSRLARRRGRRASASRPARSSTELARRRRRAGLAAPDAPPRPEPRACRATRRRRSRRCGPSTATGPTWPTSSSTATAASPADLGRFDSQRPGRWPSTSTRIRTSPSTSARCCSARRPA